MLATQKHPLFAVETVLGTDKLLLRQFSLNDELSRLFGLEAELASDDPAIKFDDIEGFEPGTCKVCFPDLDKEAWEKL